MSKLNKYHWFWSHNHLFKIFVWETLALIISTNELYSLVIKTNELFKVFSFQFYLFHKLFVHIVSSIEIYIFAFEVQYYIYLLKAQTGSYDY